MQEAEVAQLHARLDANGDGKVSVDEFIKFVEEGLARMLLLSTDKLSPAPAASAAAACADEPKMRVKRALSRPEVEAVL